MRFFLLLLRSIALLCWVLPLPSVAAWDGVDVALESRDGVDGIAWPVAVNVPFAPGEVRKGTPLSLERGGRRLASQVEPLVEWPDGSLRWVRIDGILPARSHGPLRVVAKPGPAPRPALRMQEKTDGIFVDTGAVVFEVPRARFAIAENLRLGRTHKPLLAAVSTSLIADGQFSHASPPKALRITRQGPVHGEIELRGDLGSDFEYLIRLAVDAGSPFVRILHTYVKTGGRADSLVERLAIDVPYTVELEASYSVGRSAGKPLEGQVATSPVFAQIDNAIFDADGNRNRGHLAGWFEVASDSGAVGLGSRWYWQEYPKAVTLGPKGITFDLWSPRGGTARIGIGSAKTHELVVWLARRGTVGKARAAATSRPLRGFVAPAYLARTGALRNAIDPDSTSFDEVLQKAARRYRKRNARERWVDCGQERCGDARESVTRTGAYGMLNWGDWNFPGVGDDVKGTDAWGNLEYDTTQVLALAHAATGDAALFDQMAAAARHFMDVDTIHALPARPEWVGMNHPKNPRHFEFDLGGVDLGHTWVEGLLSYYQLTGDRRGLEVARGIADYLVRRLRDFLRGNPRQWGWPQVALVAMYDVTRESRYLDAAKGYASAAMRAHPPKPDRKWKLGILAEGLAYTHAYAGGKDIEAWLRQYADEVERKRPRDSRFYPAVAYIGRVTGEKSWLDLAADRIDRLDLGNWGKPFTIQGRIGLRILSIAQGSGIRAQGPGRVPSDR